MYFQKKRDDALKAATRKAFVHKDKKIIRHGADKRPLMHAIG